MTPAGTSNELDVQNGWEENTHTLYKKTYCFDVGLQAAMCNQGPLGCCARRRSDFYLITERMLCVENVQPTMSGNPFKFHQEVLSLRPICQQQFL